MKNFKKIGLLVLAITIAKFTLPEAVYAINTSDVTMSVGETQTLYLPYSVTSKDLRSVAFYSNGIEYVQVVSYNNYSVTVKAIKAFSSPLIVRCDYYYYVWNGSYTYQSTGFYDFRITVYGNGSSTGVEPTWIGFSSSAVGLEVGESRRLTPRVLPENAQYTLTWSINDSSVATISQEGVLVGRKAGTADLKVKTDNGLYTMLRVVVSEPEPENIWVTPSSISITEGESRYLSAEVYPSNANQSVSWSSNTPAIVSVSSSGKITGLKAGTATITARSSNGKTDTCIVTCNAAIRSITLSDKDGISELPERANVTYERLLYSGWNSVCVPFALNQKMLDDMCEGCKIATIAHLETIGSNRVLSITEVQTVDAGMPCMIYSPTEFLCQFVLNDVSLSVEPNKSSPLKGAYKNETIGRNMYKLSSDGTSFGITQTDDAYVAPFRAYIQINESSNSRTILLNDTKTTNTLIYEN